MSTNTPLNPAYVADRASAVRRALAGRSIVLVGIMGVGKSTIGKKLAELTGMPFVDADKEIERAADLTIAEIFERYGEKYFRSGEKRVISRLLTDGPVIMATGGGAFMDSETRDIIGEKSVSIWLNAELDVLMKRVLRRTHRPLLQQGDPEATMKALLEERNPTYALADFQVQSRNTSHDVIAAEVLEILADGLDEEEASAKAS